MIWSFVYRWNLFFFVIHLALLLSPTMKLLYRKEPYPLQMCPRLSVGPSFSPPVWPSIAMVPLLWNSMEIDIFSTNQSQWSKLGVLIEHTSLALYMGLVCRGYYFSLRRDVWGRCGSSVLLLRRYAIIVETFNRISGSEGNKTSITGKYSPILKADCTIVGIFLTSLI